MTAAFWYFLLRKKALSARILLWYDAHGISLHMRFYFIAGRCTFGLAYLHVAIHFLLLTGSRMPCKSGSVVSFFVALAFEARRSEQSSTLFVTKSVSEARCSESVIWSLIVANF